MNKLITEIYKSCRTKEALASQEQFQSANVLLGTEIEKFAELIVRECVAWVEDNNGHDGPSISEMKEHFGVEE